MFELHKIVVCDCGIKKYMFEIVDSSKDEMIVEWDLNRKVRKGEYKNNLEVDDLIYNGKSWLKNYYDYDFLNLLIHNYFDFLDHYDLNKVRESNQRMCENATHFRILDYNEIHKEKDGSIWKKWDFIPKEKFSKFDLDEILDCTATFDGIIRQRIITKMML